MGHLHQRHRPTAFLRKSRRLLPVRYARAGATTWEGGTRVPGIMHWPGHIPSNSTNDTMLMTIDLFPMIAKAKNYK